MKSNLILLLFLAIFSVTNAQTTASTAGSKSEKAVAHMTRTQFIDEVFDHTKGEEKWSFKGNTPMIIDFYASWCGPCKRLEPILEELAQTYKGKVRIVKVNTETERQLAGELGVQSLPTLLFVPAKGDPQVVMGLQPKGELVKLINDVLKVK